MSADGSDEEGVARLPEGLRDRVIACILLVTTAVFGWDSVAIRAAEAKMYPRLVLIVLAGLSMLLFLRGWRMDRTVRRDPVVIGARPFVAFLILSTVYAVAIAYLGFFTSSVVYIPLTAWMLGLRRHGLNAIVTTVFLVATWLVFVALFARPLPPEFLGGLL